MEQQRLFFLFALAIVGYFLYDAWTDFQDEKNTAQTPPAVTAEQTPSDDPSGDTANTDGAAEDSTADNASDGNTSDGDASQQANNVKSTAAAVKQTISVTTDLLRAEISTRGASLTKYSARLPQNQEKYSLLLDDNSQTGLFAYVINGLAPKDDQTKPNWSINFTAEQTQYAFSEQDKDGAELVVPLTATLANGLKLRYEYVFTKGDYLVKQRIRIENAGTVAWEGRLGTSFARNGYINEDNNIPLDPAGSFNGFAMSAIDPDDYADADKDADGNRFLANLDRDYNQFTFEDLVDEGAVIETAATGGWFALAEKYFIAALLPNPTDQSTVTMRAKATNGGLNDRYFMVVKSAPVVVKPQDTFTTERGFYIGPKIQDRLDDYAESLSDTVDYGIWAPLAQPLFWIMNQLYQLIGIWGVVILLITLIMKAAFYKLTEAQYKSMAKMRAFSPRIKALKERYADDRQRQQQEMMKLFKKEKINPLGGCLPILLQMPVFIALFWVLRESVELRYVSFLWLPDLTEKDPYFILPILFAVSMFVQQRLSASTATMDPMQAKIMSLLPLFLGVMFAFFPSGLVLYWVANNLISMTQQWYINRKIEKEQLKRATH